MLGTELESLQEQQVYPTAKPSLQPKRLLFLTLVICRLRVCKFLSFKLFMTPKPSLCSVSMVNHEHLPSSQKRITIQYVCSLLICVFVSLCILVLAYVHTQKPERGVGCPLIALHPFFLRQGMFSQLGWKLTSPKCPPDSTPFHAEVLLLRPSFYGSWDPELQTPRLCSKCP